MIAYSNEMKKNENALSMKYTRMNMDSFISSSGNSMLNQEALIVQ